MKISVFGLGYVGCVSVGCLSNNGHEIVGVDIDENKVNCINEGKPTIVEPEIGALISAGRAMDNISATNNPVEAVKITEMSIICVGTPCKSDGQLNLDYIFQATTQIATAIHEKDSFHLIVIRSTVFPGTCEEAEKLIESKSGKKKDIDFAVISNPEFLREGSAVKDYYSPPYTLIGGRNTEAIKKISQIYSNLDAELIVVDTEIAEIIKYINNTFHALKVGFANEVGNICKSLNIDSHQVMDVFCRDTKLNISPYYLKPGFAYGGSCLPKDLGALQAYSRDIQLKTPIINSIEESNNYQIQRTVDMLIATGKKSFGFLGLSFKAGTDDLRNSPIISVVKKLIDQGFQISLYDKNVNLSNLTGANKKYIGIHIPHISKYINNELNDVVESSDVLVIGNSDPDFAIVLENLIDKYVFDLVHMVKEPKKIHNYIGINW
jgi:GDP-mannose 6-dehydrogenase